MYLAGNISKLQEATSWHPRISMAEGLAELAEEARQSLE
jgi:nucleoside-diphosphate-sugar epimerase